MGIRNVFIEDADETEAPPSEVLRLGVVGDRVFLSIEKFEEGYDWSTTNTIAQISVPMRELLQGLSVCADDFVFNLDELNA